MRKIFIIDDNKDLRWSLGETLRNEKYEVTGFSCGEDALEVLPNNLPDLIVLDMKIPGKMGGIEVLKGIKEINNKLPVIILTAYGDIDSVVETMQDGAYDFMQKPFKNKLLIYKIKNAIEKFDLVLEVKAIQRRLKQQDFLKSIMGNSERIQEVHKRIMMVTSTDMTVLIQGESGTGKEIVAQTIHNYSPRKDHEFVAIDCGAIPDNLLESEFFGYKKGAFTGADRNKTGQFLLAEKGTIFLDEIANLSYNMQGKLLRFLQEHTIQPVGAIEKIKVGVRIIVASNKNLLEEVKAGKFRDDLFYRLNEFEINMPPLRERIEDIPLLSNIFLQQVILKLQIPKRELSPESIAKLCSYKWPGNARELRNLVGRAALISKGTVTPEDIIFSEPSFDYNGEPEYTDITIDADAGGTAATNGLRTTTGTDADIYQNIIFGKNAYGRIKLNKSSYETIVKGLGENGSDALNQRMTTGYKCRFGAVLLYTEKVMVYYCGATA